MIPLAPQQANIDRGARLPLYNLPFTVDIAGPLEVDVVEAAFGDLLVRHRSLRTTFPDSPWGPRQLFVDDPSTMKSVFRSAPFSEDAVTDVLSAPFDVRSQLPVRATLFERESGDHVLACSVHHIAADGWSLGVLARDFATAFSSRTLGTAPEWTDAPLHYSDFSVWAEGNSDESDLEFWRRELSDVPFDTSVPNDRPRESDWDYTGDRVEFDVNSQTVEGLDRIAQRYRTSRFTVLRSALVVLLARLTGEKDLLIGTPIAGRGDPILEQVVGMFVNTLAIRSDIGKAATFEEVIGIAHASEVRAFDHSGVSFDQVVAELDPSPHRGRHPLFQVALSLDVFTVSQFDVGSTHFEVVPVLSA
ncbi:condensation domain-containing protein [Rhodococcus sp. P1Y]|uniref:condensation domain-containing protein n=1 Tax=Rhodococcus sp. P1Y TaxID=1302308 RepID=UPI001F36C727|nr:condensation domain-containing protein [Rhodococcus sp. P1Y]